MSKHKPAVDITLLFSRTGYRSTRTQLNQRPNIPKIPADPVGENVEG